MAKKITFIISSKDHPINSFIDDWISKNSTKYDIQIARNSTEANGGDICFLISCNEIVDQDVLKNYKHSLVIHASDLPLGRGWSPHIWAILNDEDSIIISLLEASKEVDTGNIWKKLKLKIEKHLLYEDIINTINKAHIDLINFAVDNYEKILPEPQNNLIEPTYFKKRGPLDSKISVDKNIREQFNLLRTCDSSRFPAFFELNGHKYKLIIEKYENN